jgi:hypothetical protein
LVSAGGVERLAYTRLQAAEALGVSVSTLDRRVVPVISTVETEWGSRLIPVWELERYLRERTVPASGAASSRRLRGRPRRVPADVAARIRAAYEAGESLGAIARSLDADGVRTAQGGRRWWPSTVRSVLVWSEAVRG